jgi:hypothetical protein
MTRRFWVGLALTVPVAALEMGEHFTAVRLRFEPSLSNWMQLALATPVVFWAGWPFFVRGWQSMLTRKLNMFTLIAIGTGVAWSYSVIATVVPDVFPPAFRSGMGEVAVYFESCAGICSGKFWNCVHASEPPARSALSSILRPRLHGVSPIAGPRAKSRSRSLPPAIICACIRARRSQLTARSSKAAPRSTNRW